MHSETQEQASQSRPLRTQGTSRKKYPDSLAKKHEYEPFEQLLREAGYKETRVFTPESDRIKALHAHSPNDGKGGNEVKKLRGVVNFLAGFIQKRGEADDDDDTPTDRDGVTGGDRHFVSPPSPSPSPRRSLSPPTASDSFGGAHGLIQPQPQQYIYTQHHPINQPQHTNSSQLGQAQPQPKYLRSQHLQAKASSSTLRRDRESSFSRQSSIQNMGQMSPPPVPQAQLQGKQSYSQLRGGNSVYSQNSRPTTPTARPITPYKRPSTAQSQVPPKSITPKPGPRPERSFTSIYEAPPPSKAHAYLKHMASMQGIGLGEEEQTPRPSRTIDMGPFTSNSGSSSGSGSASSRSQSQSRSRSSLGTSPECDCPEELDEVEEDEDEYDGVYFSRIRSYSRSQTTDDDNGKEVERKTWLSSVLWREEAGARRVNNRLIRSASTSTAKPKRKPMRTQSSVASLAPPVAPSPTSATSSPSKMPIPLLMTQTRSRGRAVEARETKVHCRSSSAPPPRRRDKGKEKAKGPVLESRLDFEDTVEEVGVPVPLEDPRERYLSGWGMPERARSTDIRGKDKRAPLRQNSIKSLKKHLQIPISHPPMPQRSWSTGRDSRKGLPPGWADSSQR